MLTLDNGPHGSCTVLKWHSCTRMSIKRATKWRSPGTGESRGFGFRRGNLATDEGSPSRSEEACGPPKHQRRLGLMVKS